MNKSKLKSFLSLLGLVAASAITAHGQIVWGGLNTITSDSDISLAGTYVDAVGNVGGGGVTVDVNGTNVTFHSLTLTTANNYTDGHDITFSNIVSNSGGDSYNGSSSGVSVAYSTAMASVAYTGNGQGPDTGTVTLSNLTKGDIYQLEVWQAVSGEAPSRDTTFGSVGGVDSVATTGGNFIIGTFTADSATQAFTYTGQTGELNTVELRDLGPTTTTPEPSSVALSLAGLGGLALLAYRRRAVTPQA